MSQSSTTANCSVNCDVFFILLPIELVARGRMEVRPARATASPEAFVGCLKKAGAPTVSIEDMGRIAREDGAGQR
jgi:hypothetical protein